MSKIKSIGFLFWLSKAWSKGIRYFREHKSQGEIMKISAINSMYINNRNLQTKPQIKFGESEVFDTDSTKKPQKTMQTYVKIWTLFLLSFLIIAIS